MNETKFCDLCDVCDSPNTPATDEHVDENYRLNLCRECHLYWHRSHQTNGIILEAA
jgi:hypothetical protein